MALTFNTTGNCIPGEHYMLPPQDRLTRTLDLIDRKKYFVFYGGWQTGKTTCAKWLADHFNQEGPYACLWVDVQTAREQPEAEIVFETILAKLSLAVERTLPEVAAPAVEPYLKNPLIALVTYLQELCRRLPRPLVLLFDEVDSLVGHAMVSFLTQLRDGYLARDKVPFPHSVVLIGRRQVRDYTPSAQDRRAVSWLGSYREAGPHLMLMAFLQRIVNGGGRIEREYGLGRGALDLMVSWKDERHAIEVKLRRDTETEKDALVQVARYLDRAGLDHGWLVLFDQRKRRSWKEKLTRRKKKVAGKIIWVVGC